MADEAAPVETLVTAPVEPVATPAPAEGAPAPVEADKPAGEAEAKPEGDKGGDEAVPEEYADFKMPEGVEVDAAALDEARPLFKELGLSQDKAQRLVDFYAKQMGGFAEAVPAIVHQHTAEQEKSWRGETTTDAEIGGDKLSDTITFAAKAMDEFGTPGLRKVLGETGAGSHPEVVRFISKVGKALSEDGFFGAGGKAAGAPQDAASILYPNDIPKGA